MSINSDALGRKSLKRRTAFSDTNLLLIITIAVFIVMYICAVVFLKKGFTKPQTFFNILNENASLLVLSCGMTLVMITGGIDISVGTMTALVGMSCAVYLDTAIGKGGNVPVAILIALGITRDTRVDVLHDRQMQVPGTGNLQIRLLGTFEAAAEVDDLGDPKLA